MTPVYSYLDLINLTGYLLTSNWFVQIFFFYYCILRFLQIKSVQVCVHQNDGDSLRKPLPAAVAAKNIIKWFHLFFSRELTMFSGRFLRKWFQFFELAAKILLQISSHSLNFDLPFMVYFGRFHTLLFWCTPPFIWNLTVLLRSDFPLQN